MKKAGKHVENARKKVEARPYKLAEATEQIKKTHHTKFNETVELAINLGVDPKHSDQVVRGTVVLPNGLGKSVRVLVLAGGEKQREATEAGAEFVGGDDLVQKIMEGWTDFDAVIATPDMMRSAGKLGKVLGPRGLMPNPKTGTVTADISKAVKETKAGKKAKPAPAKEASAPRAESKGAKILELIGRPKGATLAEIVKATDWQKHSIRGFLSTAAKKHGLKIESTKTEAGDRVYQIRK